MFDVVIFDPEKAELNKIHKTVFDTASVLSEDAWDWHLFSEPAPLGGYLSRDGAADFSCVDVTVPSGVGAAERIRSRNRLGFIMLVADQSVSPVTYLKPSIVPGALLLRPFSQALLQSTVRDAVSGLLDTFSQQNDAVGFQMNLKTERKLIPYAQIFYFEARDKKIYLNAGNREYAFYDTIDHLESILPAGFVRCHRSFIAAKAKVKAIYISKNYLQLENGMEIPVSRSYKAALKELK